MTRSGRHSLQRRLSRDDGADLILARVNTTEGTRRCSSRLRKAVGRESAHLVHLSEGQRSCPDRKRCALNRPGGGHRRHQGCGRFPNPHRAALRPAPRRSLIPRSCIIVEARQHIQHRARAPQEVHEDWHHRPAPGRQDIPVQDSYQGQARGARLLQSSRGAHRRGPRARRSAGEALGSLFTQEDHLRHASNMSMLPPSARKRSRKPPSSPACATSTR